MTTWHSRQVVEEISVMDKAASSLVSDPRENEMGATKPFMTLEAICDVGCFDSVCFVPGCWMSSNAVFSPASAFKLCKTANLHHICLHPNLSNNNPRTLFLPMTKEVFLHDLP